MASSVCLIPAVDFSPRGLLVLRLSKFSFLLSKDTYLPSRVAFPARGTTSLEQTHNLTQPCLGFAAAPRFPFFL